MRRRRFRGLTKAGQPGWHAYKKTAAYCPSDVRPAPIPTAATRRYGLHLPGAS